MTNKKEGLKVLMYHQKIKVLGRLRVRLKHLNLSKHDKMTSSFIFIFKRHGISPVGIPENSLEFNGVFK